MTALPDNVSLFVDGLYLAGIVTGLLILIAGIQLGRRRHPPKWAAQRYADHLNDTTPTRTRKWKW